MANSLQDQPGQTTPPAVEIEDSGDDSGFDEMTIASTVASLHESIWEYRTLHGRTYQASGTIAYHLPNDNQQLESFDLAHHWMNLLLDDKLYLAPIENPRRVLDVGTGTGIWAIDFADRYPASEVIGTDISPTQPSWVPPNLRFLIEDVQEPWTWPEDYFDFIHIRHMVGAIGDWRTLYRQVFTHIKPGGWYQHCDFDIQTRSDTGLVGPDHVFNRWCELQFEAAEKAGRSLKYPIENGQMKNLMEETGFVDVVQRSWKIPIGGWMSDKRMKHVGLFALEYLDSALEGFALQPLSEMMGWEYEKIVEIQQVLRGALRRSRLQPYFTLYLTYGRKPN